MDRGSLLLHNGGVRQPATCVELYHHATMAANVRTDENMILRGAAENGHLSVCRWLADEFGLTKDDIESLDNEAFRKAAEGGHLEVCKWIIKHFGVGRMHVHTYSNYALRMAAANGHVEVCEWILDNFHVSQTDVLAMNNYAMQHAYVNGHFHVCRLLVGHFGTHTFSAFVSIYYLERWADEWLTARKTVSECMVFPPRQPKLTGLMKICL